MFQFKETNLKDVFEIELPFHGDTRGGFTKIFQNSIWQNKGLDFQLRESYFSKSDKDVVRGMHFQIPPHEHHKIVYCPQGCFLDVVLDLRTHSSTYGQSISCLLSATNHKALFIPKGCAHGFKSLDANTLTTYLVSSEYNPDADRGIAWDSFDFDWGIDQPTLSSRDAKFEAFKDFQSPF